MAQLSSTASITAHLDEESTVSGLRSRHGGKAVYFAWQKKRAAAHIIKYRRRFHAMKVKAAYMRSIAEPIKNPIRSFIPEK